MPQPLADVRGTDHQVLVLVLVLVLARRAPGVGQQVRSRCGGPLAARGPTSTYVAWGPLTGTVAAVDAGPVYISERPSEGMGYAAAAVGDVDGDSFEDIVVGALDAADPEPLGAVYLFRGGGW